MYAVSEYRSIGEGIDGRLGVTWLMIEMKVRGLSESMQTIGKRR